jgi:hypothetical protein
MFENLFLAEAFQARIFFDNKNKFQNSCQSSKEDILNDILILLFWLFNVKSHNKGFII